MRKHQFSILIPISLTNLDTNEGADVLIESFYDTAITPFYGHRVK
jgi:hypothetical protein